MTKINGSGESMSLVSKVVNEMWGDVDITLTPSQPHLSDDPSSPYIGFVAFDNISKSEEESVTNHYPWGVKAVKENNYFICFELEEDYQKWYDWKLSEIGSNE